MIVLSHSGGAFGSASTSTSATSGAATFGTSAVFGQTTASRLIQHNLSITLAPLSGHSFRRLILLVITPFGGHFSHTTPTGTDKHTDEYTRRLVYTNKQTGKHTHKRTYRHRHHKTLRLTNYVLHFSGFGSRRIVWVVNCDHDSVGGWRWRRWWAVLAQGAAAVGCSGDWVGNPTRRTPTRMSLVAPPHSGAQRQRLQVKGTTSYHRPFS